MTDRVERAAPHVFDRSDPSIPFAASALAQGPMSFIEFKFKSDHQFERVDLDSGKSSLTAWELRQIVTDRRLNGSAGAFGLKLSNSQTGEGWHPPSHNSRGHRDALVSS